MKRSHLQPRSPEWHEARSKHVGSSDASILMGAAPKYWGTPQSLYLEKKGLKTRDNTQFMERGVRLESWARTEFEQTFDMAVPEAVVFSDEYDWMMASLDGLSLDNSVLVEIKCPGPKDHATALEGSVPSKYYPQLQHQMAVTGLKLAHYYSYDGDSGVIVEVKRDEDYINKMIDKEKAFWDCLDKNILPPSTPNEYQLRLDDQWLKHARAVREARLQIKALEEQEKEHRELLIRLAGDTNCAGGGVRLGKSNVPGRIEFKNIPELSGVDLETYRGKPSTRWTLNLEDT